MKPFGYWHQGDSEDESEFFLFSESGEVACRYCVALYTKQQVDEHEELKRKLAEQQICNRNAFTTYAALPDFRREAWLKGYEMYGNKEELNSLLAKAKEEGRKEAVSEDTARLDYLISHDAFVVKREADSGAITYQLWTQNEDEIYHVLHEESIFLQSPREAIDAAMLAAAPKPHNQD